MRIAIIGTGNVGGALGRTWADHGHEIVFGVRDPKHPQPLVDEIAGARAVSVADAATSAETVVLALPWEATKDAISSAGNLAGKTVIDCTNPIKLGMDGLRGGLVLGLTTSAAESVAQWAAGARVVKAFNTIGAGNFATPQFGSQAATMFICGDDADAKQRVAQLATEMGFDVVDAGNLAIARLLEPLGMFWIHLALLRGLGTDIAFKLLRR
jgi:predicted dinucleotide-binding enzyme